MNQGADDKIPQKRKNVYWGGRRGNDTPCRIGIKPPQKKLKKNTSNPRPFFRAKGGDRGVSLD